MIISKSYPQTNIDWVDPFFNNVIIENNQRYAEEFLKFNKITVTFLEKLIKRYQTFCSIFRQQNSRTSTVQQQNITNRDYTSIPQSFFQSISKMRNEIESQLCATLENFLEKILFDRTIYEMTLLDKYRLVKQTDSDRLTKRLMRSEKSSYLNDLKSLDLLK